MKRFQFRAQAALDLRHREHDDARRVLARAEMDLRAAREVLAGADARLAGAREQGSHSMQTATDAGLLQWYRFWIVRLRHERAACAQAVTAREGEVARATAVCVTTRQRVESLERFRDKARHAWERAVLADEQKQLDSFATLRYVAVSRESAARSNS